MAAALAMLEWSKRETGDAGSEQAPGVGIGDDAGASGESSNSVDISTGGLIAIIVVVVAVVVLGGRPSILMPAVWKVLTISHRHHCGFVLRREAARMDHERNDQALGEEGQDRPHAAQVRIPRLSQRLG